MHELINFSNIRKYIDHYSNKDFYFIGRNSFQKIAYVGLLDQDRTKHSSKELFHVE